MTRFLVTAAIALTFICSSALARGPYGQIQIGNWNGGAYTNDQSGQFSHCAAGTQYLSGVHFLVSVNNNMDWMLGFAHKGWQLKIGEVIPLELTFDGRTPVHVYGNAIQTAFVVVQMPPNSQLVQQFRNATQMTALAKGQLFTFNLTATSHLLPALVNCMNQAKSGVALSSIVIKERTRRPPSASRPTGPTG